MPSTPLGRTFVWLGLQRCLQASESLALVDDEYSFGARVYTIL